MNFLYLSDSLDPPLHIPDRNGQPYKTELVVSRTEDQVIKANWWHQPDINRDEIDLPHNHPWNFKSKILKGYYVEERWTRSNTGWKKSTNRYDPSDEIYVSVDTFHRVIEIEKGTLSMMNCGPVIRPKWGYLDPETERFHLPKDDKEFITHLKLNNRFLI